MLYLVVIKTSAFWSQLGHSSFWDLGPTSLYILIPSSIKWKIGLGVSLLMLLLSLTGCSSGTWEGLAQLFHYWFLSLVLWWHSRICLCFIQFLNYTLIPVLAAYTSLANFSSAQIAEWCLVILSSFLQNQHNSGQLKVNAVSSILWLIV